MRKIAALITGALIVALPGLSWGHYWFQRPTVNPQSVTTTSQPITGAPVVSATITRFFCRSADGLLTLNGPHLTLEAANSACDLPSPSTALGAQRRVFEVAASTSTVSTTTTTTTTTPRTDVFGGTTVRVNDAHAQIITAIGQTDGTVVVPPAPDADWYVNGTCPNNGDGTAATCAASGGATGAWNDIQVDCDGAISDGDIIELIDNGEFDYESTNQNNGYDITTGCNGAIFRNASGDVITITAFLDDSGNTWTDEGNGEYSCTTCGRDHPNRPAWHAWYANGGSRVEVNYRALTRASYACGDGSLSDNEIFMDADGTICVQLPSDASPADMDYFRLPHARMIMDLAGTSDITFQTHPDDGDSRMIQFHGAQQYGVATTLSGPFLFDGVSIGYVEDRCTNDTQTSTLQDVALQFENVEIAYCGQEGIRVDTRSATTSYIRNSVIHNIQSPTMFPVCSGVGDCPDATDGDDNATSMRLAKVSNITVENVTCHSSGGGLSNTNTGRCVDFESDSVTTPQVACTDCIVDGLYVYSSSPGDYAGINVGGTQTRDIDGTIIRNSRFHDVDQCLEVAAGTFVAGTVRWVNNTCHEYDQTGIHFNSVTMSGGGALAIDVVNSIFDSSINPSDSLSTITATDADISLTLSNSLFYLPGGGANDEAVDDNGTLIDYDVGGGTNIATYCATCDDADAGLTEAIGTAATDLTIPSTMSAAYQAGVADADVTDDFEGEARSNPPDAGADEYVP